MRATRLSSNSVRSAKSGGVEGTRCITGSNVRCGGGAPHLTAPDVPAAPRLARTRAPSQMVGRAAPWRRRGPASSDHDRATSAFPAIHDSPRRTVLAAPSTRRSQSLPTRSAPFFGYRPCNLALRSAQYVAISVGDSPRSSNSVKISGAKLCRPVSPAALAKMSADRFAFDRPAAHGRWRRRRSGRRAGTPTALDFVGGAERRVAFAAPAEPDQVVLRHAEVMDAGLAGRLRPHRPVHGGDVEAARERRMRHVHVRAGGEPDFEDLQVGERLGERRPGAAC